VLQEAITQLTVSQTFHIASSDFFKLFSKRLFKGIVKMSEEVQRNTEHFIVIVPGFGGSLLRSKQTGALVYIDFSQVLLIRPWKWNDWFTELIDRLKYPNDDLEPAGLVNEVVFLLPWAKQEHYGRLFKALERIGYRVDPKRYTEPERDVYAFSYDWRQDNRKSAEQLDEAIEGWRRHHPGAEVWIIAHSNGGLVARWYIEQRGGKAYVGRLFLMGSPVDGAPKAMQIAFQGFDIFLRRYFNLFGAKQKTRDLFRTFPALYQLIPTSNPFLRNTNNVDVDLFASNRWLTDSQQLQYLADGQTFAQQLGRKTSVETMVFFGRRKPTTTSGIVHFSANQRWDRIDWTTMEAGDGTVPERSSTALDTTQQIPFAALHGDIYVSAPVLEILAWELSDKQQQPDRAALITERLKIIFEPDEDVYNPGEKINLRATIHENDSGAPVSGAGITVQMFWRGALLGATEPTPPPSSRKSHLWEDEKVEGRYEGSMSAPEVEGFYSLVATIEAESEPTLSLEELIAVEAVPEHPPEASADD
jgi:pimeloyl-ACP methyl ester carboxylesterase